ncbi:uncharacterized protein PHACADRAFT_259262, partial [Phanerochaete carnosa HHB-10118-sp]
MWNDHQIAPWRKLTRRTPGTASHPAIPGGIGTDAAFDWRVNFENWRRRVFLLRAHMLAFVQQILAFTTFEVLEPNWHKLEGKPEAGKVETVDFLDTGLKEYMLSSSKLATVSPL